MLNLIEIVSNIIAWLLIILACGFGISLILSGFYILGKHLIANIWGVKALTKFYLHLINENKK